MAGRQEPERSSRLGRFFHRIADFFDRLSGEAPSPHSGAHGEARATKFRGSRTEVDVFTFGMLAAGILVLGTIIHGWGFFLYSAIFAAVFSGGAWLIFKSRDFDIRVRSALLCLLLAFALPSVSARLMPLAAFAVVCGAQVLVLVGRWRKTGESISAAAVILFCFMSYDAFSAIIENRRNAKLQIEKTVGVDCSYHGGRTVCSTGDVAFHVPEFWQKGTASNLIADLANISDLRVFADSASETRMAFVAFKATPAELNQALASFFYTQKGFLRSRGLKGEPLTLQQVMRSSDAELYALQYTSAKRPEYLGEKQESHALVLFHIPNATRPTGRDQTWLFIIDGPDLAGREYLLHRIVSGFK